MWAGRVSGQCEGAQPAASLSVLALGRSIHDRAKGPADVLDHATSEIASGSKLGIDATKKMPGKGFKRASPPLIRMDERVRKKIDALFVGAKQ